MRKERQHQSQGCPLRRRRVKEYRKLGYKRWRDRYRLWLPLACFRETSQAVKRRTGEYVRAARMGNMCWEVKIEFLFYNSILKFDATGELPWATTSQK
ncbi:MAG: hypothetical protein QXR19_10640 [Candidatus Jordarchaeaceae archaeon]